MAERPVDDFSLQKLSFFWRNKYSRIYCSYVVVVIQTIFPLACVGYDMVIAKLTPLHGWLSAISHPMLGYG